MYMMDMYYSCITVYVEQVNDVPVVNQTITHIAIWETKWTGNLTKLYFYSFEF